ncbi:hypothetical protein Agub_g5319, partial [Astrephomene gubernaculifera]
DAWLRPAGSFPVLPVEPMRSLLGSLPRLRLLDLSHCTSGVVDQVLRAALAPRAWPLQQQQPQQPAAVATAAAAGGGGEGGQLPQPQQQQPAGGGGGWALPCPLRVLRARDCPRLGPGTLKALTPDVPHVTLPPPPPQAADAASTTSPLPPPAIATTSPAAPAAAAAATTTDGATAAGSSSGGGDGLVVPLFVHLTELDLT